MTKRRGFLIAAIVAAGCGGNSGGAAKPDGGAGGIAVETGAGGAAGTGKGGAGGAAPGAGGSSTPRDAGPGDVGMSPAAANLGKGCSADSDCGPGLRCLKATDTVLANGGPAHGYCTTACTDDVDCAPLGGLCIDYRLNSADPPQAYCFQTCLYGDQDRTAKCQGRADVGCLQDSASALTFCLPMCSQDSDCPAGRKCDLLNNVCADTPATGDRIGAHCTPDATGASTCAGLCLSIGGAASICTSSCVLGELGACGWVGQGTSLAGGVHGVCALGSSGAAPGDVGFCTAECDSVADCPDKTDPGPTCDLSQRSAIGHGACSFTGGATDGGRG